MTSGPVHLCDGLEDRIMDLAVDAAVNRVDQAVALAAAGIHKEGRREDPLAAGSEDDVDRVVHAAGHDRLDAGSIRPAAEDMGRPRDERRLARPLVGLLGERPLAPVDPAVGPEIRAMQVVGAAGERLALEPLDSLVGHAVAVGIRQLPDARRRGDVERAAVPHRSFGEHHLVGEDGLLVEFSVAVGVFQPDNPMRLLRKLLLDVVVGAGGIGDIEPALVVERGGDRSVDERRPGDPLDRKSVGKHEHAAVELDLARMAGAGESRQDHEDAGKADEIPRWGDRFMSKSLRTVPIWFRASRPTNQRPSNFARPINATNLKMF